LTVVFLGVMLSIQYDSEKIEFYYMFAGGLAFLAGWGLVNRTGVPSK
jgi:hypothetical protein